MKKVIIEELGITIPEPENYRDCFMLIRSDYFRCTGSKKDSFIKMFLFALREPSFMFQIWWRLSMVKGWAYLFTKLLHRHYMFKLGLYIPSTARVGYGFLIGHPAGIIINHTAIIGNNVNIS